MTFWDERYRADGYFYGVEPNDFLRATSASIPRGRVLCLAEGEGRNAVFLASLGHSVVAVDQSSEGLRKAERLARERGVTLELMQADLADYEPLGPFTAVISIFAHLPKPLRQRVHEMIPSLLAPGGMFILEAYRPEQLAFGTGGPRDVALLPTVPELQQELAALDLVLVQAVERDIQEGTHHYGRSATVQLLGRRR